MIYFVLVAVWVCLCILVGRYAQGKGLARDEISSGR